MMQCSPLPLSNLQTPKKYSNVVDCRLSEHCTITDIRLSSTHSASHSNWHPPQQHTLSTPQLQSAHNGNLDSCHNRQNTAQNRCHSNVMRHLTIFTSLKSTDMVEIYQKVRVYHHSHLKSRLQKTWHTGI